MSTTTACVGDGDEFVLNCTVHSLSHAWTVPPFDETSVSRARPETELQQFTFRLVADTHDSIISSLTGVANEQLSGTVVSCSDGLVTAGEGEVQETTVIVLTAGIFNSKTCKFNLYHTCIQVLHQHQT